LATIDVLLPVRNGMPYLNEAIESIRSQTYPDWRLLILDHGSSDASLETALDYQEKDRRISVHSHPEADGIGALRNIGLDKCDSRYVLIQDADDISVGNRMEITLDAFKAAPDLLAVGGEAIVVDADGNRTGYLRAPSSSAAITAAAFFYYPMVHPAAAINFTAIRRLGAAYGKDFLNVVPASESITVNRFAEDYILFGQLALLGLCANIPVPLIKYRRHGNSVGVANHAAQVEASLRISRFLSKSFCLMNRAEEFDPGPFCNHADFVFDFRRKDYSAQFDRMARSLWRGLGPSPELARELAFRRVLAKRKYAPMMYRYMEFQYRYAAQPPERRTVRNWLLRNLRRNKYVYRPAPCHAN
jgi:glycosyltransferase involved in cell wall biosynthesis